MFNIFKRKSKEFRDIDDIIKNVDNIPDIKLPDDFDIAKFHRELRKLAKTNKKVAYVLRAFNYR